MIQHTANLITDLLKTYDPADVVGWMRKHHNVVVTYADVREVYDALPLEVLGATKRIGARNPAIIPADFAKWNATEGNPELSKRYGVGFSMLARWRREAGVEARERTQEQRGGRKRMETPADFAEFARGKSVRELVEHYGISTEAVRRMRNEAGLPPVAAGWARVNAARAKPAHLVTNAYMSTPLNRTVKDGSRAGLAADYLRRDAPVYRCRPLGAADANGSHWRYGRVVLSDAELIERAERKGWSADAWKRVA